MHLETLFKFVIGEYMDYQATLYQSKMESSAQKPQTGHYWSTLKLKPTPGYETCKDQKPTQLMI